MKQYTVYKLVFPNGKMYVGTTSQFRARMRSHRFASIHGGTRPIQKALRKYGWDTVNVEIVSENLSEEKAYNLEMKLIKDLNTKTNGYNCADGGKVNKGYSTGIAWNKGKKLTEAHRNALKKAKKGKDYSDVSRKNSTAYPVVAVHRYTGEVKKFINATACGEYFGINPSNVYNHIYRNSKYLITEWTVRRTLNQKEG